MMDASLIQITDDVAQCRVCGDYCPIDQPCHPAAGPNPCICPEQKVQCTFWEGPCPYAA